MGEKQYLIKMYQYIEGELKLIIREFDRIEDAIEHGIKEACHSYKIYDKDGCLHHDSHGDQSGEYC